MGDSDLCKGCGFVIEPHYWVGWVGETPDFCMRCRTTLHWLARRWREQVTDSRTLTHIKFGKEYAERFAHGAPGHLDLMTIGLLTGILDDPFKVLR